MKTILMTAVAAATLIAAPAFAQSSSTINLNGNVANKCGVGNHIGGPGTASGFTEGAVTIAELADSNGQINAPITVATNRSFGSLWCNYAAPVKLEVGALKSTTAVYDQGSFANTFDVRVTTDAGVYFGQGENYQLSSTNGADGVISNTTLGAFETGSGRFGGLDKIEVLPNARAAGGNYRPVAGAYTGFVRFTVGSN